MKSFLITLAVAFISFTCVVMIQESRKNNVNQVSNVYTDEYGNEYTIGEDGIGVMTKEVYDPDKEYDTTYLSGGRKLILPKMVSNSDPIANAGRTINLKKK